MYGLGQALRVPGCSASHILRKSAPEGGIASSTHGPPLHLLKYSVSGRVHFRAIVRMEGSYR